MRVLHITNWYPSTENPMEALFIKRQVKNLQRFCNNELWHLEVRSSKAFLRIKYKKISEWENSLIISSRIGIWKFREILTTILLLVFLLYKRIVNWNFEVLNFHIAYPLCLNFSQVQKFIKAPVFISEHWSAYHYYFNLKRNCPKLRKIKQIFHNPKISLVTVSKELGEDVKRFSNNASIRINVVPNYINTEVYNYKPSSIRVKTLFILNNWSNSKKPEVIIRAFHAFSQSMKEEVVLKIGGWGKKWNLILDLVNQLGFINKIQILGELTEEEVAHHMNNSNVFIQSSSYETFSIVCAEAICCGCPVIANRIPALEEYLDSSNSILLEEGSEIEYLNAFNAFFQMKFDRKQISKRARNLFNPEQTGLKYYRLLAESKTKATRNHNSV